VSIEGGDCWSLRSLSLAIGVLELNGEPLASGLEYSDPGDFPGRLFVGLGVLSSLRIDPSIGLLGTDGCVGIGE